MLTVPCCSFSALLPGAEPFPRYPSGWSFLYRSQSSDGNGFPSYLVGPIQHFSANYVFAGYHKESKAGFYNETHHTSSFFIDGEGLMVREDAGSEGVR